MHICSNCGNELAEGVKFCGSCGSRLVTDSLLPGPGTCAISVTSQARDLSSGSAAGAARAPLRASAIAPIQHASDEASNVVRQMKAGELGKALQSARNWWLALQWPVRLAVVGAGLLLVMWLLSLAAADSLTPEGTILVTLGMIPFSFGALAALARPEPALEWMSQFVRWSGIKRDRARQKGTFLGTWFFAPLYSSFCLAAEWTSSVKDPYLRTGATFGLQILMVYAALLVAYIAIVVVIGLILLVLAIWFIGWLLSQGSGSGGSLYRYTSSGSGGGWLPGGRSEERKDFGGNKYEQHYDAQGRKAGRSEQKKDFFGNEYVQHYDQEGSKAGRSEPKEGFFGNKYEQHYDQEGNKAGRSEQREGFFGDKYEQHYDQEGKKAGRTEQREGFFGDKYKKHRED